MIPSTDYSKPERQFPEVRLCTTPGKAQNAVIRAVMEDNFRDAEKLVELFHSHAGPNHPYQFVYDTQFWSTGGASVLGNQVFTSVVAELENEFIAHMAIKHEPDYSALEIMLPAFHQKFHDQVMKLSRALWSFIETQAERQHRKVILQYHSTSHPLFQFISAKCFHTQAVAFTPVLRSPSPNNGQKKTSQRKDDRVLTMFFLSPHDHTLKRKLYPPEKHTPVIREMYNSLNICREFGSADKITSQSAHEPLCSKDEQNGFFFSHRKRFGTFELKIIPTLVHSNKDLKMVKLFAERCRPKNCSIALHILLNDPKCPEVCEGLQALGYRFSGIIPALGDNDYVVYTELPNADLLRMRLYARSARKLRQYMLQTGAPDNSVD